MAATETLDVPVAGMSCEDCAAEVTTALKRLPGITDVRVLLAGERAVVTFDPQRTGSEQLLSTIQSVLAGAGCSLGGAAAAAKGSDPGALGGFTRQIMGLFGVVFAVVALAAIGGEWFGLFDALNRRLPLPLGLVVVIAAGFPVLRAVLRAGLKRRVTSHTLMTLGVVAALVVGQWVTALLVVFFMRIGEYAERFTPERSRQALRDLTALAPRAARLNWEGIEEQVPAGAVPLGAIVVVRPGEQIPVDGEVVSGQATVNQAAITGESMPVEVGPGSQVFAATLAQLGSLRIRTTSVGPDSTFGRVVKLVEEAEAHRADVQRVADKFSAYYLPVVVATAALTLLLRRDPLATAAVLVVACSCSFALATPIAMLASVGAAAKRGLLIKGGKYLEVLARADVLLIDKTGTLTLGRPQLTDVYSLDGLSEEGLLSLAATAERYSEHPLAEAVRRAARQRGLSLGEPEQFESVPGLGVRALVEGRQLAVGSRRLILQDSLPPRAAEFEAQGKTVLAVARNGRLIGLLAAADTLRAEVPEAMAALRRLGIRQIELLTGDNERTAAALGERLHIAHRANLLPEDKIAAVKRYQAEGHRVIMVGDGVNDAPALAQADVGIAMGAAGTAVAVEAAHIALMRDDWTLVPDAVRIARRTMRVVKGNIAFTVVYNFAGLALAALGFLPPVLAAVAQSLPDLGILGNSSRLLRQK